MENIKVIIYLMFEDSIIGRLVSSIYKFFIKYKIIIIFIILLVYYIYIYNNTLIDNILNEDIAINSNLNKKNIKLNNQMVSKCINFMSKKRNYFPSFFLKNNLIICNTSCYIEYNSNIDPYYSQNTTLWLQITGNSLGKQLLILNNIDNILSNYF